MVVAGTDDFLNIIFVVFSVSARLCHIQDNCQLYQDFFNSLIILKLFFVKVLQDNLRNRWVNVLRLSWIIEYFRIVETFNLICVIFYFQWDAFSLPELQNFMRVLDREEGEYCSQLEYKYKVMRKIIQQRLKELRKEKLAEKRKSLGLASW